MRETKEQVFAPFHAASDQVWIRSTGHFRLNSPDRASWKRADFAELFWGISGTGEFVYQGKTTVLKPDQLFYYPPGSFHCFSPGKGHFEYRWLSIEGKYAAMMFELLGITSGRSYCGTCPVESFTELAIILSQPTLKKRRRALSIAFDILNRAARPSLSLKSYDKIEQARSIIEENYANPELNIQCIADELSISRVYLSREFVKRNGVPISNYLISYRIEKSLLLLKDTMLPIAEVAEQSGFSSPGYLGKVIKKLTGHSPGDLRPQTGKRVSGSRD